MFNQEDKKPALTRRNTVVEEAAEGLLEEKRHKLEKLAKKKTFKERFADFKKSIYNSEYREFLSRDGKAWLQLSFFYFIFFSCLSGIFIGLLAVFYQTIDLQAPTYYNEESVMNYAKVNPGMGFRPQVNPEDLLILVNKSDTRKFNELVKSIDNFLKKYDIEGNDDIVIIPNKAGRTVRYNYNESIKDSPCSKENKYGFSSGSPCILLKMNKIYGWKPKAYKEPPKELNVTMTDELNNLTESATKEVQKFIYVKCEGENAFDKDNIGQVDYYSMYPSREVGGIPTKYFPYRNQQNYLSPLVFAHFKDLKKNVLVNIDCKLYAENIDNKDKFNQRGMVKFEIYVAA